MMRPALLLASLLASFASKAQDTTTRQISTPSGPVSLTSQTVEDFPQKMTLLDAAG